jgi:hypothetical protein
LPQLVLVLPNGVAFWNNGLLGPTDPQDHFWITVSWIGTSFCQFLVYFSLIGFLAQFILRWLVLCRFDFLFLGII